MGRRVQAGDMGDSTVKSLTGSTASADSGGRSTLDLSDTTLKDPDTPPDTENGQPNRIEPDKNSPSLNVSSDGKVIYRQEELFSSSEGVARRPEKSSLGFRLEYQSLSVEEVSSLSLRDEKNAHQPGVEKNPVSEESAHEQDPNALASENSPGESTQSSVPGRDQSRVRPQRSASTLNSRDRERGRRGPLSELWRKFIGVGSLLGDQRVSHGIESEHQSGTDVSRGKVLEHRPLIGALVAVNLYLAVLISNLPFFEAVREDLMILFGTVFLGLGVYCWSLGVRRSWRELRAETEAYEVGSGLLTFLALILGGAALLIRLTSFPVETLENFAFEPFVVASGLLLVLFSVRRSVEESLLISSSFDPRRSVSPVRRFSSLRPIKFEDDKAGEEVINGSLVVPHDQLSVGDIIALEVGSVLPADVRVLSGAVTVLEREAGTTSVPRIKQPGSTVRALSCVVLGGGTAKVEAPLSTSSAGWGISALSSVLKVDSAELRASRFAAWVICSVLLVCAAISGTVAGYRSESFPMGLEVGMAVLFLGTLLPLTNLPAQLSRISLVRMFFSGAFVRSQEALQAFRKMKTVVFDGTDPSEFGKAGIVQVELVDARFSQEALLGVLFSIVSAVEEADGFGASELASSLYAFISTEDIRFPQQLSLYPGKGIAAVVEGVEFSFGPESFLLERGVQLQPSESGSERILLLAVGDEPVLRLVLSRRGVEVMRSLRKDLEANGVRTILAARESGDTPILYGKEVGLDLTDIKTGLTDSSFEEMFTAIQPFAIFSPTDRVISLPAAKKGLTIGYYFDGDTLLERDITLLGGTLEEFLGAFRSVHRLTKFEKQAVILTTIIIVPTIAGASLAIIGAQTVILSAIILFTALLLLLNRSLREEE